MLPSQSLIPITDGQEWINDYTNKRVVVMKYVEGLVTLKTDTGFIYVYPETQFRREYTVGI